MSYWQELRSKELIDARLAEAANSRLGRAGHAGAARQAGPRAGGVRRWARMLVDREVGLGSARGHGAR